MSLEKYKALTENSDTLKNKLQDLTSFVTQQMFFLEKLYKKVPYQINDLVALKTNFGPFDEYHGWKAYEHILVQGTIGKIVDIDLCINDLDKEELCYFICLVEIPMVYYNSRIHYGTHIPEECKSGYYNNNSTSCFYFRADKLELANQCSRLEP